MQYGNIIIETIEAKNSELGVIISVRKDGRLLVGMWSLSGELFDSNSSSVNLFNQSNQIQPPLNF